MAAHLVEHLVARKDESKELLLVELLVVLMGIHSVGQLVRWTENWLVVSSAVYLVAMKELMTVETLDMSLAAV